MTTDHDTYGRNPAKNVLKTACSNSASQLRTISWSELPHWRQDNQYILASYRLTSSSYTESLKSWFYLHNQSVNIHSHLFAAVFFLFLAIYLFLFTPTSPELPKIAVQPSFSSTDILAFSFFFVGAILCLGISAGYHTICNHSPRVNQWGNQLDYVGIVALITGSFIPSVYYGFYCAPHLQKVYWTMVRSIRSFTSSPLSSTPVNSVSL